jgi:hypothetical protein
LRNRKQVEGGVGAERGKNFPSVQLGGCLIFRPTLEEGYYCWFIEALAHWWFLCVLWVYFHHLSSNLTISSMSNPVASVSPKNVTSPTSTNPTVKSDPIVLAGQSN